jgi:hypothetical protein
VLLLLDPGEIPLEREERRCAGQNALVRRSRGIPFKRLQE